MGDGPTTVTWGCLSLAPAQHMATELQLFRRTVVPGLGSHTKRVALEALQHLQVSVKPQNPVLIN